MAIEGYRVGQDGTSLRTTQAGGVRVTQQYAETNSALNSAGNLVVKETFNNQFSAALNATSALVAVNTAGTVISVGAALGSVVSLRTTQSDDTRVDQAGNPRVTQNATTSSLVITEVFAAGASATFTGPSAIMAIGSPPHALFYKTGGQWLHLRPYAKFQDGWVPVKKVFIRSNGAWQLAYES